ncbi:MAG: DUF63 family protein [Methanotrichaceae archaeon]
MLIPDKTLPLLTTSSAGSLLLQWWMEYAGYNGAKNIAVYRDTVNRSESQLYPWIYKYYVEPILLDTGYNPVNTITWAAILGVMLLIIDRLFKQLDLKLDESLILYTIPYILAGSSLRVIEDAEIVAPPAKYLLITPPIYFFVFAVAVTLLLLCKKLLDKEFLKVYATLGFLWTSINLAILATTVGVERIWALVAILGLGSTLTGVIWLLRSNLRLYFLDLRYNLLILYAHLLDASSTYIGVDWLGYHEKHVIPTLLIDLTGTALVMYPLKLAILIPVLSLIDDSLSEEPALKTLTKLALLILGLGPAVRNTLRLTMGI